MRVSKPGEVGARRAQRKKVVLANPNANDVELPPLSVRVSDGADGTVVKFDGPTIDMLRALEVFQTKQGWQFFHGPSTLIRKESVELGKLLAWVNGEVVRSGEGSGVESEGKAEGERGRENVGEDVSENVNECVSEHKGGNENVIVSENGSTNENEGDNGDSGAGEKVLERGWIPSGGYVTTPEVIPEVLIDELKKYKDLMGESRSGRRVITGPKGVGKSILLLQVMAWAQQRNWLVISIPNGMFPPPHIPPPRTNLSSLHPPLPSQPRTS